MSTVRSSQPAISAFDNLACRFYSRSTRRSAMGLLLGMALMGGAPASAARKGRRPKAKHRRKATERQRHEVAAQGRNNSAPHCISPSGLDLNAFYGVAEQVVATFCPPVHAGHSWRPASRWDTAPNFEAYDELPPGFEPVGDTPQEDFVAKFQAATYVVDPGTRQETAVVFPKDARLFTLQQDDFAVTSPITLGVLKPLSVGDHAVDIHWRLSAMHCDGFGDEPGVNCLAAGDFFYGRWEFTVTPGP